METPRCDGKTGRALRLFVALTRCYNSVTAHARRDIERHKIGEHRLNVSEFAVLELLYHRGPTPLGELAQRVLVTTGSITYVVDNLEKRGLVQRVGCPKDRRVCHAALTETGREWIGAIFPDHAGAIERAVSGLTEDEQETLTALLKKMGLAAQALPLCAAVRAEKAPETEETKTPA